MIDKHGGLKELLQFWFSLRFKTHCLFYTNFVSSHSDQISLNNPTLNDFHGVYPMTQEEWTPEFNCLSRLIMFHGYFPARCQRLKLFWIGSIVNWIRSWHQSSEAAWASAMANPFDHVFISNIFMIKVCSKGKLIIYNQ